MAELFSRYMSGTQWTAGTMTGSIMGESGINPMVDRLNSITTADNLITGSVVSGTSAVFLGSIVNALDVSGTNFYLDDAHVKGDISGTTAVFTGSKVNALVFSGTDSVISVSGGTIGGFWSCNGVNFVAKDYNTNHVEYASGTGELYAATSTELLAPVSLPHGVTVTAAACYGNAGTENVIWNLKRTTFGSGGATSLASDTFNTEDTSISNAVIDNSTYNYFFFSTALTIGDRVYGARVTYTP